MSKARVFVVNQPTKYDHDQKTFVPSVDLTPAREFGELVYLTPIGAGFDPAAMLDTLRENLNGFTEDDFLLPIGSPVLIAWAAGIAANLTGGKIKLLEWPRRNHPNFGRYYPITAYLF